MYQVRLESKFESYVSCIHISHPSFQLERSPRPVEDEQARTANDQRTVKFSTNPGITSVPAYSMEDFTSYQKVNRKRNLCTGLSVDIPANFSRLIHLPTPDHGMRRT